MSLVTRVRLFQLTRRSRRWATGRLPQRYVRKHTGQDHYSFGIGHGHPGASFDLIANGGEGISRVPMVTLGIFCHR
jgi:hypothetical protein